MTCKQKNRHGPRLRFIVLLSRGLYYIVSVGSEALLPLSLASQCKEYLRYVAGHELEKNQRTL